MPVIQSVSFFLFTVRELSFLKGQFLNLSYGWVIVSPLVACYVVLLLTEICLALPLSSRVMTTLLIITHITRDVFIHWWIFFFSVISNLFMSNHSSLSCYFTIPLSPPPNLYYYSLYPSFRYSSLFYLYLYNITWIPLSIY
jgi:hypothetical protein